MATLNLTINCSPQDMMSYMEKKELINKKMNKEFKSIMLQLNKETKKEIKRVIENFKEIVKT